MAKRDWSLVFFTILAQWSIGIILCLTLLTFFSTDSGAVFETGPGLKNPVLLALVFIGTATLSSLLHLGKPVNAPRALNNLKGSWLSREILAIGVYSMSLVIVLVLAWKTGHSDNLKLPLALSSVFGLALLWMMVRIYVMPTIPAWNSWSTPVSFASTALCLGLLTFAYLHSSSFIAAPEQGIRYFWILLVIILLVEIISVVAHQSHLAKMETGLNDLAFDTGTFYRIFLLRIAILIIACVLIVFIALEVEWLPAFHHPLWLSLLFILVMTQELMGRLLFYSSYFRLGV